MPAAAACDPRRRLRTRGRRAPATCSQPASARPQITNTAKLKRMSKKQLKMVRKADTSGVAPKDVARQAIFPKSVASRARAGGRVVVLALHLAVPHVGVLASTEFVRENSRARPRAAAEACRRKARRRVGFITVAQGNITVQGLLRRLARASVRMRATALLRRSGGLAHKACRAVDTPPAYVRMSTVAATRPFFASKPLGGVHKRWSTSVADADFYSSLTPELWQSLRPSPPVTEREVLDVQQSWADADRAHLEDAQGEGRLHRRGGGGGGRALPYGHHDVLFKPTKAAEVPFRPTAGEAMSYFVGGKAVDGGYDEDGGFAINGGKGFKKVVYRNHQIALKGNVALAMGEYDFTCATTGDESKVEYTFGYQRCQDDKVRIFLHHSSVPYKP